MTRTWGPPKAGCFVLAPTYNQPTREPASIPILVEPPFRHKDFAVAVAKRNGKALKFMLPIFRADPEVVRAAVSRDPQAAQFAHASRRAELGMIQESIYGEVQLKEDRQRQTYQTAHAMRRHRFN